MSFVGADKWNPGYQEKTLFEAESHLYPFAIEAPVCDRALLDNTFKDSSIHLIDMKPVNLNDFMRTQKLEVVALVRFKTQEDLDLYLLLSQYQEFKRVK